MKGADPAALFRTRARRDRVQILRLVELLDGEGVAVLAELERIAHGLAGAGGVFGHADVSEAAARVERLSERWRIADLATLSPRRKSLLAGAVRGLAARLSMVESSSIADALCTQNQS